MSGNNLTGGLSSLWGGPGVFPNLVSMDLSGNYLLGGILLTQWGTPGSFPKLEVLPCAFHCLDANPMFNLDRPLCILAAMLQGPGGAASQILPFSLARDKVHHLGWWARRSACLQEQSSLYRH